VIQLIQGQCVFCNRIFSIKANGIIEDFNGDTLDCPHCEQSMIIQDGKLINLNKYLLSAYRKWYTIK
jgi:hypothetical protein